MTPWEAHTVSQLEKGPNHLKTACEVLERWGDETELCLAKKKASLRRREIEGNKQSTFIGSQAWRWSAGGGQQVHTYVWCDMMRVAVK